MVICTLSTWLRFQNGSRNVFAKRKYSRLLTGALPEVMVDAEDALTRGRSPSRIRFKLLRGGEIVSERLFDDDARAIGAAGLASCSTTVPNRTGGMAR